MSLIKEIKNKKKCLIYFDPPYYVQGKKLYTNFYKHDDHAVLARSIVSLSITWVLTYDNVEAVKTLYRNLETKEFGINYSAKTHIKGSEVMFINNMPLTSRNFMNILSK